ncbi:MAG: SDR family oxidoreductase [Myxococcota bacterium]
MITIVTGAAGNLGAAVVSHLCERGGHVIAVDRDGAQESLAALAQRFPGKVETFTFDVGDRAAWAQTALRLQGRELAGAAFLAGAWSGGQPVGAGGDTWRKMMSTNADTVYASLEAVLPLMKARGNGSIVVVGARPVELPGTAGTAAEYAAAKSAVVALARAAAAEALTSRVRINAVLPSIIDTPPNRKAMPGAKHDTWVSPASLADVIGFLLSDSARDVSGAMIPVYGRA